MCLLSGGLCALSRKYIHLYIDSFVEKFTFHLYIDSFVEKFALTILDSYDAKLLVRPPVVTLNIRFANFAVNIAI